MKPTSKLTIGVFTFLALTTSAYAQSPREQLNQMVHQLQKTPNDNALREKIIKLAMEIKPAPSIPEEAREPFVMGATVLKRASGPAGASKAVDLFTQAISIAPWFADAYYNRAIAREAAGQFEPAIDDLKLYLGFKLTNAERREAQDKIYALKANAQLASATEAEEVKAVAAKVAAERERLRPSVEGRWTNGLIEFQVIKSGEKFDIIPGLLSGLVGQWDAPSIQVDRQRVRFVFRNLKLKCPDCNPFRLDLSLSASGNELTGTGTYDNGGSYPNTFTRRP